MHIVFKNGNIEIDVFTEPLCLPYVMISDGTSYEYIENTEQNELIKKIRKKHSRRVGPKFKRVFDSEDVDTTEIDIDYKRTAKHEHEAILKEHAEIIRRNPKILVGEIK